MIILGKALIRVETCFSVVLAVQKRRAFCTNDPIKEKTGSSLSSTDTRPTRSAIRKQSKIEETSEGGYFMKIITGTWPECQQGISCQ